MSGSNDAPRGGSGWRRPSVILAVLAVGFAVYTVLRPAPPAPVEAPNQASAGLVSEFSGVATVSDGDTIRIGTQRFQLDGIAAPSRTVRCGDVNVYRAATDALRDVTRSRQVVCRISNQPDAQGQSRARCRVEDIDLNAYMVEAGWAREWPRAGAYAEQEAAARAAERGVWSPSCPADVWGPDLNPRP